MEVKDFVTTTLEQLHQAIEETKESTEGKKVILTNTSLQAKNKGNYGHVEFDLAVEATRSKSNDKSGGVKISVLQAKLGDEKEFTSSSVSRIKFVIEADF